MDVSMEKKDNKMIMIAVGVFVLLVAVWFFFFRNKKTTTPPPSSSGGGGEEKPTIYGSLGCPYTIKQMEKYKEHEFVDCSSGGCPSFVTAYPTTKWPNGKIEIGFS